MENWLRSIGLGDRVADFRGHQIEFDQLLDLTDEDLRELGLTIGERKRFRRALASLEARPPQDLPIEQLARTSRAERRPMTVMFIDLVGSTALGERLEPEDLLIVI